MNFKLKKSWLAVVLLLPAAFFSQGPVEAKKEHSSGKDPKNYYDTNILEFNQTPPSKTKKRHHRPKTGKSNSKTSPNPTEPQEEVTDQREVSQQADQSGKNQKP